MNDIITIGGRDYRMVVSQPSCGGQCHYHNEAHADGSPGTDRHHHHTPQCADLPRQATLYPVTTGPARHIHQFTGGTCGCGADRDILGPGKKRETIHVQYRMPSDNDHPQGWSYERDDDDTR